MTTKDLFKVVPDVSLFFLLQKSVKVQDLRRAVLRVLEGKLSHSGLMEDTRCSTVLDGSRCFKTCRYFSVLMEFIQLPQTQMHTHTIREAGF